MTAHTETLLAPIAWLNAMSNARRRLTCAQRQTGLPFIAPELFRTRIGGARRDAFEPAWDLSRFSGALTLIDVRAGSRATFGYAPAAGRAATPGTLEPHAIPATAPGGPNASVRFDAHLDSGAPESKRNSI